MLTKKEKKRVIAALKDLEMDYLAAERLMLDRDREKLRERLLAVDASYNELMNLCGGMSDSDSMPGSSSRKIDRIRGKAEFDARVEQWLRDIATPPHAPETSYHSPPASIPSESRGSELAKSTLSSKSSTCSYKMKESRVKLNLARLARKQDEERREEALKRAQQEAELADKESQRRLELAEAEYTAWEEVASVHSLNHEQSIKIDCFKPITSPVCVEPCNVEPRAPTVNSMINNHPLTPELKPKVQFTPTEYAHRIDQPSRTENCFRSFLPVQNESQHLVEGNKVLGDSNTRSLQPRDLPPRHARSLGEVGERFLPKPQITKFDGDPMDYWAFVNRFRIHITDRLDQGWATSGTRAELGTRARISGTRARSQKRDPFLQR